MANTYSAGIVTAYGAAVRGGYTGTYEEFCAQQAAFAENAEQVAEDRAAVEQIKTTFENQTVPAAVQQVNQAGAAQVQAVQAAGDAEERDIAAAGAAQETRVLQAGADQEDAVNAAGSTQVQAIQTAGTAQVTAVQDAGSTQVQAVQTAGAAQVGAVEDKGAEVLESIPADYTELTGEVDDLKSAIGNIENMEMIDTSFSWESGDFDINGAEIVSPGIRRTDSFLSAVPFSVKINGGTTLYVYWYRDDHSFISSDRTAVDATFDPHTIAGCAYMRFSTREANVDLFEFSEYPLIINQINLLGNENTQVFRQLSVDISTQYEHIGIVSTTGKLMIYADGARTRRRTPKYLEIRKGVGRVKATYSSGTLHIFEYNENKEFIDWHNLTSGAYRTLDINTAWVRFEHIDYAGGQVIVEYPAKTIAPVWGYGTRENGNTIPFVYRVHPCRATDNSAENLSFNDDAVFTSGLLMLPPNYTENGNKVPVIYFAHGSADYGGITYTEFSASYMDYLHYLRDEGYAIFDCYGWTNKYTTSGAQMANPTNMAAIKQGLEWVGRNYNVDISRTYVTGKSLGGLQAINMCYEGDFHIKACCPLAPALDAAEIGFGYDVPSRKSYAEDLCFSPDTGDVLSEVWSGTLSSASAAYKAYALANADKLLGYNPIYRNLIGVDASEFVQFEIDGQGGSGTGQDLPNKLKTMSRICTTPTKIIMAVDDNAVSPTQCDAYIQSIKNTGGVAEMRWLPANSGKHHAVDNDPNAPKVASITTACGVAYTNVPLAYAEMVQFFRRYS